MEDVHICSVYGLTSYVSAVPYFYSHTKKGRLTNDQIVTCVLHSRLYWPTCRLLTLVSALSMGTYAFIVFMIFF